MRKYSFIILIITVFAYCSCTEEISSVENANNLSREINSRDYSEALRIAQESIALLSSSTTRGESNNREIDIAKTKVITRLTTRGASMGKDTLIFVFNFKDDKGFALVSGSLATEGLLAVTEKGNYNPEQPTEIEGFDEFVERAEQYVKVASSGRALKPDPNDPHDPEQYRDSIVITYNVPHPTAFDPPYPPINWGQNTPEGDFCSNSIGGCVNIAIGEIMMYFSYPTSIQLTYPNADKSMEVLNWTNINNHTPGLYIPFCCDTVTHYSIARLVRQIGELTHSYYGSDYTSSTKNWAKTALQGLGFTVGDWENYNSYNIKNDIFDGCIFMVSGNSISGGHAWLLDHMIEKITTIYQLRWTSNMGWIPTGIVDTTTSVLLHYNWGEYGTCNGYFCEQVYNMSQAEILDNTGYNSYGYTYINPQFLSVSHLSL